MSSEAGSNEAGQTSGNANEISGAEKTKQSCSDCKNYWQTLRSPESRTLDELLYFIRRHFYVFLIYTVLSFYDAVLAAIRAGTTSSMFYIGYSIMSYLNSMLYVLYVIGIVLLSRIKMPDYVVSVVFRMLLGVLIFFSLLLWIYSVIFDIVGMLVSQFGAVYLHSSCFYIWCHIARRISNRNRDGFSEVLVDSAGGASV